MKRGEGGIDRREGGISRGEGGIETEEGRIERVERMIEGRGRVERGDGESFIPAASVYAIQVTNRSSLHSLHPSPYEPLTQSLSLSFMTF